MWLMSIDQIWRQLLREGISVASVGYGAGNSCHGPCQMDGNDREKWYKKDFEQKTASTLE